jgi:hypothetical protein
MNLWANFITLIIMPVFISLDLTLKEKRTKPKESCYNLFEYEILLGLIALYLVKNVLLERSIMKRFVEDQPQESTELRSPKSSP